MILLLKPIPRPAIWGNTRLRDYFDFKDFPLGIGQSWSFSAQEGNSNTILTSPFKGKTLSDVWVENPELFNSSEDHFPFIIGLVAPEDDLSIQVHPDAEAAKKLGYPYGKNEAWYFIDAPQDGSIVFDQNATNIEELNQYIEKGKWLDLVRHHPVKTGDFVYIPAGTLHAMKKNLITYEVQEATDITYRFYDYDRKDSTGLPRDLHLQEAINSMTFQPPQPPHQPLQTTINGSIITEYINNESFRIKKVVIRSFATFNSINYECATVIRGNGKIDGISVKAGDAFLIPALQKDIAIEGHLEIMMTSEPQK